MSTIAVVTVVLNRGDGVGRMPLSRFHGEALIQEDDFLEAAFSFHLEVDEGASAESVANTAFAICNGMSHREIAKAYYASGVERRSVSVADVFIVTLMASGDPVEDTTALVVASCGFEVVATGAEARVMLAAGRIIREALAGSVDVDATIRGIRGVAA